MDYNLNLKTALGEVIVHIESEMDDHTFKTIYIGSVQGHRIVVQGDSVEEVIQEIHISIEVKLRHEQGKI